MPQRNPSLRLKVGGSTRCVNQVFFQLNRMPAFKKALLHEKYEERNCVSVPLKTPRLFVQTPSVFPGGRTEALTNCLPWDELP